MKKFFKSAGAFVRSAPSFLLFELLFRLVVLAIGAPAMALLLKITMKAAHIKYLSDEHILTYLKNPATVAFLVIMLFVIAVFSFVELTALTGCFACYLRRERISVGNMFRTGIYSLRKAFHSGGIFSFLLFMVYMPMAQFTLSSASFTAPLMPVLREIFRSAGTKGLIAVYILIQLLFVVIIAGKSYTMHFLVLTDLSFRESSVRSRQLLNGRKLKMALSLLLWSLFLALMTAVIVFAVSFVVLLFIKGFSRPGRALTSSLRVLSYGSKVFLAIGSFLSGPVIICWLTSKFFEDIDSSDNVILPERSGSKLSSPVRAVIMCGTVVSGLLLNLSYVKALYKGNISLNVGILSDTQITAHRGFSKVAPENTKYAFEAAVDSPADYIELDVQLTSDGKLVVFHDLTIDRTTDGKGKLSGYTYDELQKYSAGSWFSSGGEFDDARIMLLSDVLALVDGKKLMNIEIKDAGEPVRTAEATVAVIQEYGIEDSCYVTSFSYPALRRVKQLDPTIKTGIIANVSTIMAFSQMNNVDALSMNYLFVNQTVVNNAHQNGKRIFVWTVDRPAYIRRMVSMGVDNIITNRPDKAAEIIYSNSSGETVLNVLRLVFGG